MPTNLSIFSGAWKNFLFSTSYSCWFAAVNYTNLLLKRDPFALHTIPLKSGAYSDLERDQILKFFLYQSHFQVVESILEIVIQL